MPIADETPEETAAREKAYYTEQKIQADSLKTVDAALKETQSFISEMASKDPMLQPIENDPYLVAKKSGGCLVM